MNFLWFILLSGCCFLIENIHSSNNFNLGLELFQDKNVLVLGGTGYLGSGIIEEIIQYNPRQVISFSRDEVKHFKFSQKFGHHRNVESVVGDIRDYQSIVKAMSGMDVVIHCAALKRMDLIESNVEEAIKTNILGSLNIFNAALVAKPAKVLFISTDKATNPINAYGACKFVSEKIFTNYDTSKISTKFVVVRFGNILDSTGSVLPIFIEKMKQGSPITLTDARMTRFIISRADAVELIFDALYYANGGEIFVKALPAMKIIDLIEVLKEQYHSMVDIKTIGLRPGEKIHEMLINESEMERAVIFNNYYVIKPSILKSTDISEKKPIVREYSSNQALISKNELSFLLNELGVL